MFRKLREFFRDVTIEIKKVTFPKKDELVGSTWVVIVSVLIISVYLGVVDLALSKIVKVLLR
jgi:preprotein translocase subunit SecE